VIFQANNQLLNNQFSAPTPPPVPQPAVDQTNRRISKGSISSAMNWMSLLSLLLFWLPFFGPFIAGLVGGKKAGGVKRAIIATFLPAVINAVLFFILGTLLTHMAIFGFIAAIGGVALGLINIGPLFAGAIVGGFLGSPKNSPAV